MNKRHLTSAILGALFFTWNAPAQNFKITQTEVQLEPTGDIGENDLFGGSVAVSANGKTPVVGGQGANSTFAQDTGAVFVFERVNNTWQQTARLLPDNAIFEDGFGNAVAISEDGNTIAVGADLQSGS